MGLGSILKSVQDPKAGHSVKYRCWIIPSLFSKREEIFLQTLQQLQNMTHSSYINDVESIFQLLEGEGGRKEKIAARCRCEHLMWMFNTWIFNRLTSNLCRRNISKTNQNQTKTGGKIWFGGIREILRILINLSNTEKAFRELWKIREDGSHMNKNLVYSDERSENSFPVSEVEQVLPPYKNSQKPSILRS